MSHNFVKTGGLSPSSLLEGVGPGLRRLADAFTSGSSGGKAPDSVNNPRSEASEPGLSMVCTHEEGGVLQKLGSDVVLTVPRGAVPEGNTYRINGRIHTNLAEFNTFMRSKDEFIIGPVPEFMVDSRGVFEKPVQIKIPHCVRLNRGTQIRVLYGSYGEFREIPEVSEAPDATDPSYSINEHFVFISTWHFTVFIVTATQAQQEITDALLTIVASRNRVENVGVIELRLMLHSHCARLNDFSAQRQQTYDPDMKEIKALVVNLPESATPVEYPTINITLDVDRTCSWGIRLPDTLHSVVRSVLSMIPRLLNWMLTTTKIEVVINGSDILKQPRNGSSHRSGHVKNFLLTNIDHPEQTLLCSMVYAFEYADIRRTIRDETNVVYPTRDVRADPPPQAQSVSYWTTPTLASNIPNIIDRNGSEILVDVMLLWELVRREVISHTQKHDLQAQNNSERNGTLLSIIRGGNFNMYMGFRESLIAVNQEAVTVLLPPVFS